MSLASLHAQVRSTQYRGAMPPRSYRDAFVRRTATRLMRAQVPLVCVQIVTVLCLAGLVPQQPYAHGAEFFAGQEAVSNGLRTFGYITLSYDLEKNPTHDITSDEGFCIALIIALSVYDGGFGWLAPVCSSWIWMCCYRTGRSFFRPGGRPTLFVTTGNMICARSMLVAAVMIAKGCMVVIGFVSFGQITAEHFKTCNIRRKNIIVRFSCLKTHPHES